MNPNINVSPSVPVAILVASIILSYFTKVAWWAIAGIIYFLVAFYAYELRNWLFNLGIILFIVAIIFGILAMNWSWNPF